MIEIRMSVADVGRMRFAYSPLAEVAQSLHHIASGRMPAPFRGWYELVRRYLDNVDLALLKAVVPGKKRIPSYLFRGATSPATTIESQLQLVAEISRELLEEKLHFVWRGEPLPPAALALISEGDSGPQHLADVLHDYWSAAIEPYWRSIRPVLDDDVAYRAAALTKGGVEAMLSDLHAELRWRGDVMQLDKRCTSAVELIGAGLMLVPSVFTWPHCGFAPSRIGASILTYAARGVGNLWMSGPRDLCEEETLGGLLGRRRAAILVALARPYSTTELALKLGQSKPAVSQHLSVLRSCGLVTSWRSGRSVLYHRTSLADSVVEPHQITNASDGLVI